MNMKNLVPTKVPLLIWFVITKVNCYFQCICCIIILPAETFLIAFTSSDCFKIRFESNYYNAIIMSPKLNSINHLHMFSLKASLLEGKEGKFVHYEFCQSIRLECYYLREIICKTNDLFSTWHCLK